MKIAIYIRYTAGCERLGLDEQRTACYKYAAEYGHTIVGEYIDCFANGVVNTPSSFEKMMCDSLNKQFQGVLVYGADRISQDVYELITCKFRLEDYGVTLISVTEFCLADPGVLLLEKLFVACFQYLRAEHSARVKRGIQLAKERRAAEKALQSTNENA
jgi:DNA invertase Pin-like site-specific DNA recombinase